MVKLFTINDVRDFIGINRLIILQAERIRKGDEMSTLLYNLHFGHSSRGPLPYAPSLGKSLAATAFYRTSGICHGRVSVCLSVCLSITSRGSTKMAKRRNMQTTPHDSSGTLVF